MKYSKRFGIEGFIEEGQAFLDIFSVIGRIVFSFWLLLAFFPFALYDAYVSF